MDVCVLGLPKSGKTSILKVIFQRMGPQYTMMLDPTLKIETINKTFGSHIQINIHDFPGTFDFRDKAGPNEINIIENCGAVIFVIDLQVEPYFENIGYLIECMKYCTKINPKMSYNIFLHKIDAESFASEEKRNDCMRQIKETIKSEVDLSGLKVGNVDYFFTTQESPLLFHEHINQSKLISYLNRVYDHSLIDSFSKVVQKVIPNVSQIVTLLDSLISNCKMQKIFLFEMISKTYLATDSAPVEPQNYAICSDMIDVVIDISFIYGVKNNKETLGFDNQTQATIKLSDSTILYYKEIEKYNLLAYLKKILNLIPFYFEIDSQHQSASLKKMISIDHFQLIIILKPSDKAQMKYSKQAVRKIFKNKNHIKLQSQNHEYFLRTITILNDNNFSVSRRCKAWLMSPQFNSNIQRF